MKHQDLVNMEYLALYQLAKKGTSREVMEFQLNKLFRNGYFQTVLEFQVIDNDKFLELNFITEGYKNEHLIVFTKLDKALQITVDGLNVMVFNIEDYSL